MSLTDEYVAKCDEAIEKGGDFERLSREICSVFHNDIDKIGYYRGGSSAPYTADDIRKLRGKIVALQERRTHELELARLSSRNISLQAEANNEVHVNVNVTISQVFDAIDALGLPDNESTLAKGLVADAQNERDPEKRGAKALKIAKWAVENGVEALKAISPILPQLLQALG